VEQFMNNEYGRIMYPYEKSMSIAEFQKNYWLVEMKNKLNKLKTSINEGKQPETALLTFITDEIKRENQRQSVVQFSFHHKDTSEEVPQELMDKLSAYFEQLTRYYSALYNKSSERKDKLTSGISEVNPDSLLILKSRHHNQSLADMVKNTNEIYRIIEYKGQFLQNYHQVYKDPENKFIKAQFYAPVKPIFGRYYPTIWVNTIIIWCFNIFFFVALYFRWLPKLFGMFQKRKG